MADVFISYHENSTGTLAQQIANALESAGISCWYAKRDMPFGGDFADIIPLQIDECKVFLLLLNEHAPQSKHIRSEMGLAFGRYNADEDIKILPLKLGEFERKPWIRYFLNQVQIIPFSAQELNQLAARIVQLLNRKPSAPPPEPEPPQPPPSPPTEPEPPQARIIDSGECGDNVTYTLYDNGQLIISGFGPMRSWIYGKNLDVPWFPQRDKISDVRIQKGVTSIGSNAFIDCENLTNVSISNSVTSIENFAFWNCIRLKSVDIPEGVTVIQDYAFYRCVNLAHINILDRVTYIRIGRDAFEACISLKSVSAPAEAKFFDSAFPRYTKVTYREKP